MRDPVQLSASFYRASLRTSHLASLFSLTSLSAPCTKRNSSGIRALHTNRGRPWLSPCLRHSKVPPPPPPPPPTTSILSSFFTPSLCRHASTSAATNSAYRSTPIASSTSASSSSPSPSLNWNNFFKLRASRRRYSLVFSILGSITTTTTTVSILTNYPHLQDAIQRVITLDPMITLGFTTLGGMGTGWLIGPIFGNLLWRALHRGKLQEFMAKEKAFFERIKRHRVDPRGASANNPVPDYYGERVSSVAGYRRWLKDQRAFNRKRGVTV